MRIRLDPWPIDTMDAQLNLTPFQGSVIDVEQDRWEALPARPIPKSLQTVYVVDGKPRMDARLLIETDGTEAVFGGYGAYVVGAVELDPHGGREAQLRDVRARRVLALCGDVKGDAVKLVPRNPHTGELLYTPYAVPGNEPTAPQQGLQRLMLGQEQELAHGLASQVPFDEDDEQEALAVLTLQDGPVRPGFKGGAVVGCVKTMQTLYVTADRAYLLSELKPGERSPILHFRYDKGGESRFTWYVRLCDAEFYQHPYAGVMRLEMHAGNNDDLPRIVRAIANLSGTLLCRLASKSFKDPRAPQNLIPTRALEQAMGRAMGDPALVMRRIRAHIAQELGVVA